MISRKPWFKKHIRQSDDPQSKHESRATMISLSLHSCTSLLFVYVPFYFIGAQHCASPTLCLTLSDYLLLDIL